MASSRTSPPCDWDCCSFYALLTWGQDLNLWQEELPLLPFELNEFLQHNIHSEVINCQPVHTNRISNFRLRGLEEFQHKNFRIRCSKRSFIQKFFHIRSELKSTSQFLDRIRWIPWKSQDEPVLFALTWNLHQLSGIWRVNPDFLLRKSRRRKRESFRRTRLYGLAIGHWLKQCCAFTSRCHWGRLEKWGRVRDFHGETPARERQRQGYFSQIPMDNGFLVVRGLIVKKVEWKTNRSEVIIVEKKFLFVVL